MARGEGLSCQANGQDGHEMVGEGVTLYTGSSNEQSDEHLSPVWALSHSANPCYSDRGQWI